MPSRLGNISQYLSWLNSLVMRSSTISICYQQSNNRNGATFCCLLFNCNKRRREKGEKEKWNGARDSGRWLSRHCPMATRDSTVWHGQANYGLLINVLTWKFMAVDFNLLSICTAAANARFQLHVELPDRPRPPLLAGALDAPSRFMAKERQRERERGGKRCVQECRSDIVRSSGNKTRTKKWLP